jgi:hypothetical protein
VNSVRHISIGRFIEVEQIRRTGEYFILLT